MSDLTLADLISDDQIFVRLKVADKGALLTELSRRASAALGVPAAAIAQALAAREALGSTGVGAGIAVPHARMENVGALSLFFARLDRPVAFDAIDGQPVDLVMLLLGPAQGPGHLAALAAVSRRLRDRAVSAAIRAAPDAASIRLLLAG